MFDSFRNKLYSVVQDGINLNNTVRRKIIEAHTSKAAPNSPDLEEQINYTAGGFLLDKYRKQWADIHERSEQNARAAELVDANMAGIHGAVRGRLETLTALSAALAVLPAAAAAVDDCTRQLRALARKVEAVEDDLLRLEALAERADFRHRQTEHLLQLTMYKEKKLAALESSRVSLAAKQAAVAREAEQQQRAALLERQRAAHAAFQGDLAQYKACGTLPVKPSGADVAQPRLEEIQLDLEDAAELDEFLNK